MPAPQLSDSPERQVHARERAVIARISAQDIAPKVDEGGAWGPLGSSQSVPKFPPLAPNNGGSLSLSVMTSGPSMHLQLYSRIEAIPKPVSEHLCHDML